MIEDLSKGISNCGVNNWLEGRGRDSINSSNVLTGHKSGLGQFRYLNKVMGGVILQSFGPFQDMSPRFQK